MDKPKFEYIPDASNTKFNLIEAHYAEKSYDENNNSGVSPANIDSEYKYQTWVQLRL